MFSHEIRLRMVATLTQITSACASIRGAIDLPELPDESLIDTIVSCTEKIRSDAEALKSESGRIDSNVANGICEFLSVKHSICVKPCGECPTPNRVDCGARWADGHPDHLGPCLHLTKSA